MVEAYGRKVRELLPDKFEHLDELVKDKFDSAPKTDTANIPGFVWNVVGTSVADAVRSLLDCDAFGLLARAWATALELHEYADEVKHPPKQKATVFLGDHKLVSNVHPIVDVSVRGFGRAHLRFTLELSAEFRSARLSIIGRQIVAIGAGDCSVSAQLKYNDVNLHPAVTTKKLELSGPMTLDPPLTIV